MILLSFGVFIIFGWANKSQGLGGGDLLDEMPFFNFFSLFLEILFPIKKKKFHFKNLFSESYSYET